MWKLILFVLPLGLDTFAVAAALGMRGLPRRERLRVSLLMSGFEMAMPVVGLLLGRALGSAIGNAADYVAIAVLAALGDPTRRAVHRCPTPPRRARSAGYRLRRHARRRHARRRSAATHLLSARQRARPNRPAETKTGLRIAAR